MACCVLAAILIGQLVALLRRWGIFWGLVRAREYEDGGHTALAWLRTRFASKSAKRGLVIAVALEIGVLGTWVVTQHGAHLYRVADVAVSGLRGERVVYAGVCAPGNGNRYVRIVLNPGTRV